MTHASLPWEIPSTGAAAGIAGRIAECIPDLHTERLYLRAPEITDFPVYAGFGRDDRGAGLRDGPPDLAAWLDFCQMLANWPLRGFGPFTMVSRADGETVGVTVIDHEFGDPETEIGWLVTPEAEGQGYATEGTKAALDFAFGPLAMKTLVSYIYAENSRSIRVAERLGGVRDSGAEAAVKPGLRVYRHNPEAHQ